ncbi:MAG: cobyrinate a,c-diamide synthase [Mycobacteriales bacterium]|nr:cobyrinate a,c-diamide synthase [Mycobacteriales bacterium]
MVSAPRLVLAAPSSGAGKTTVATGLMAALRRRGLAVSPHKVGPDYIDPGYHSLATGRPGRNLDPVLVGEDLVAPLFLHGARDADVAVVEGVMGLFDGRGATAFGSTAHVARLLDAPVVLVVDASSMSRSVAALVHGFTSYDDSVRLAGVVLNRVGSDRHEALLREALGDVPVLGVLRRDAGIEVPSRHLGLVPAAERSAEALAVVDRLALLAEASLDLDALLAVARSAGPLDALPWSPDVAITDGAQAGVIATSSGGSAPTRPVVAVFGGAAFTFSYAETTELLTAAGADVVTVDPLRDAHLPASTRGLVIGGGFPEVHAAALSANATLRADIAALATTGAPIAAECAGLLYLCEELDGLPMCGVVAATARMTDSLTLGYRETKAAVASWVGDLPVTGHEFHRTQVDPVGGGAWANGEGFVAGAVHASYLHLHWAGIPGIATRFVEAARCA